MKKGRAREASGGSLCKDCVVKSIINLKQRRQVEFGPTMCVRTCEQAEEKFYAGQHFSAPFRFHHASGQWFVATTAFALSSDLAMYLTRLVIDELDCRVFCADLCICTVINGVLKSHILTSASTSNRVRKMPADTSISSQYCLSR